MSEVINKNDYLAVLKPDYDLRDLLYRRGFNLAETSRLSGMSKTTLYKMRQHEGCDIRFARELCKIADLSFDEIFYISKEVKYIPELERHIVVAKTGEKFWLLRHKQLNMYIPCYENSPKTDRYFSYEEIIERFKSGEWLSRTKVWNEDFTARVFFHELKNN